MFTKVQLIPALFLILVIYTDTDIAAEQSDYDNLAHYLGILSEQNACEVTDLISTDVNYNFNGTNHFCIEITPLVAP